MDEKGRIVITYICAVKDASWSIISSIQAAECDAPLRETSWSILTVVAAAIASTGMLVGVVWRHRLGEAFGKEQRRRIAVFASSPVGMLLLDESFTILEAKTCHYGS